MGIEQCSTEPSLRQGRNKDIKDYPEFNENESTTYPNLWNAVRAVLRGKLRVLSASIKNMEKSHTSNLMAQLKGLEQKEANSLNRSR